MIYCHYISHTWDTVTYAYGATIDDITGVVVFHFWKEEGIEIIRKPERYVVLWRHIQSVYQVLGGVSSWGVSEKAREGDLMTVLV